MSRRPNQAGEPAGVEQDADPVDSNVEAEAIRYFGQDAATAVAYCGIDAWFDGNEGETRQWARILRRLGN